LNVVEGVRATECTLKEYWAGNSRDIERALKRLLPSERTRPERLHAAMRYSVLAGGKRLRPLLVIAAAEACGGTAEAAMPAACAVEFVHTYSLIHDDLPCMDDDDFRRGRPTCHRQFGEAIAVLAGDALLALAFEVLMHGSPAARVGRQAAILAQAAGSRHLVGGQAADLEAEGCRARLRELRFIHAGKTAAMISASLQLGAIAAGAPTRKVVALKDFGTALGHAFQIIDDILDQTASSETLGKSAGKDARDGKSTYPALMGIDAARREAERHTRAAQNALQPVGSRAHRLEEIAEHLLTRGF
jgi:geranylgeranyl diphosphate synthase, type II